MTVPAQQLRDVIASKRAVLVTGAGFSAAAVDRNGQHLPVGRALAREIWPIGFGNDPFDDASSLGEIFRVCRDSNGRALKEHLDLAFTVDPDELPQRYLDWFQLPWFRIYTLNVDDLDQAVESRTPGGANLQIISALRSRPAENWSESPVLSVHLNGDLRDYPNMTFDPVDFGSRSAHPDPWYPTFVADIVSRPVFFVGTVLDEPPLWHYLEQRGGRGGDSEARPRSWLITRDLPLARQRLLKTYNIDYWEGYERDFFEDIIEPDLPALKEVRRAALAIAPLSQPSYLVSVADELSNDPAGAPDFLLGTEPTWGDVFNGYSVVFKWDSQLLESYRQDERKLIFVHGNAGSGKSTTLRRLAITLAAQGKECLWLDVHTSASMSQIRRGCRENGPDVLFIDDADRFGEQLLPFLRGLSADSPTLTVVAASRTSRLSRLQVNLAAENFGSIEQRNLDSDDASALARSLERANRLGRLYGLPHEQRVSRILQRWDGQLLVTLISATSGGRFQDFIAGETSDLRGAKQALYGVAATAQASGTGLLSRDDILVASTHIDNSGVLALRQLLEDRLLREQDRSIGTRHRVIAEGVIEYFRGQDQLKLWVRDILHLFGMRYNPDNVTRDRYGRLLVRFLNHDFLQSLLVSPSAVSWVYEHLEDLLAGEFHFWLQRGSYETSHGDRLRAETFLAQAREMKPGDVRADTAWFYLGILKALETPADAESVISASAALDGLYAILAEQPRNSPHTYDIFLANGLKWFEAANLSRLERVELKDRLLEQARVAPLLYPTNERIRHSSRAAARLATRVV